MSKTKIAFATALSVWLLGATAFADQGVTDTEIVVGSLQDLSGPIASTGQQGRNGMQMRIDEVNASGGIHGRKIRLIVEDTGYDPKKSLLGAQKLVQRDRVFALIATLGTPPMATAIPIALEAGVLHLFPNAAHKMASEPMSPLKFAMTTTYDDQIQAAVRWLVKRDNLKRPCIFYQDDDFGMETVRGAEAGLNEAGVKVVDRASYKRGALEFSSQMAKLKSSNCDVVVLGTVVRETISVVQEVRKLGWTVTLIGTTPAYSPEIIEIGGAASEGLYASSPFTLPFAVRKDPSPQLEQWIESYRKRFGEAPKLGTVMGYTAMNLFVEAAKRAGPNLTTAAMTQAIEGLSLPPDFLGNVSFQFSPTNHVGGRAVRVNKVENGKWTAASDFLEK